MSNKAWLGVLIQLFSSSLFADDQLGRLFMTPEQRMRLEINANKSLDYKPNIQAEYLYINGFVKRNKRNTIWVNGQKTKSKQAGSYRILPKPSGNNQVLVNMTGGLAKIRPGQILDVNNQTIKERFDFEASQQEQNEQQATGINEGTPPFSDQDTSSSLQQFKQLQSNIALTKENSR